MACASSGASQTSPYAKAFREQLRPLILPQCVGTHLYGISLGKDVRTVLFATFAAARALELQSAAIPTIPTQKLG
jgi:hypothetical protein